MIAGACHCGAVRVTVPRRPRRLTSCNGSICRRLGALRAYYPVRNVCIEAKRGATDEYVGGRDRTLHIVRCGGCGCVTHWTPLRPRPGGRMGVNARNAEPADIAKARVRRFDGASSRRFLD